ncbi:Uncharacterised protein [Vibrio cholerae]|nr:Uncharacterised protein [Vibrio cholerae]
MQKKRRKCAVYIGRRMDHHCIHTILQHITVVGARRADSVTRR